MFDVDDILLDDLDVIIYYIYIYFFVLMMFNYVSLSLELLGSCTVQRLAAYAFNAGFTTG